MRGACGEMLLHYTCAYSLT